MTLTASATIGDRFAGGSGRFPLSGVQALIRLIVDVRRADRAQGLDTAAFVSGYEGSPLAGLDLELQRREQLLAEHDIVFRPAVNEELAATAVQGTQLVAGHEDARVAGITGFRPVFRLLGAMKVLRGTPLDPFGRTRVRRLERELITEYRAAVEDLLARLTDDTLADCIRVAALPDLVRGYEQIKMASVDRYRAQLHAALGALRTADANQV